MKPFRIEPSRSTHKKEIKYEGRMKAERLKRDREIEKLIAGVE